MAITPSGAALTIGSAARWTTHLLRAATEKFGLLGIALVALMAAAPLIPSEASHAALALFTGAVLVASLHAARPSESAMAIGGMATIRDKMGHCLHEFFIMMHPSNALRMEKGACQM